MIWPFHSALICLLFPGVHVAAFRPLRSDQTSNTNFAPSLLEGTHLAGARLGKIMFPVFVLHFSILHLFTMFSFHLFGLSFEIQERDEMCVSLAPIGLFHASGFRQARPVRSHRPSHTDDYYPPLLTDTLDSQATQAQSYR